MNPKELEENKEIIKVEDNVNQIRMLTSDELLTLVKDLVLKVSQINSNSYEEMMSIAIKLTENAKIINVIQQKEFEELLSEEINHLLTVKNQNTKGFAPKLIKPNNGFAKVSTITLIITFIIGIGVGIAYMLVK